MDHYYAGDTIYTSWTPGLEVPRGWTLTYVDGSPVIYRMVDGTETDLPAGTRRFRPLPDTPR